MNHYSVMAEFNDQINAENELFTQLDSLLLLFSTFVSVDVHQQQSLQIKYHCAKCSYARNI